MGQSFNVVCDTCKREWYIGYGGTPTRLEAENFQHEHETWIHYDDYTCVEDGKLIGPGYGFIDDQVIRENWSEYDFVNLTKPIKCNSCQDTGSIKGQAYNFVDSTYNLRSIKCPCKT